MAAPNFRSRGGYVQLMGSDTSNGTSLPPGPDSWRLQARCADRNLVEDPDIFYDETRYEDARQECKLCPVRGQCLDEFTDDRFAFAGGMSPSERKVWVSTGKIPVGPPTPPEVKPELTLEDRVLALVELRAGYGLICRRLGVSVRDVADIAKGHGVEMPEKRPEEFRGKVMTELARQILIGLYLGDLPRVVADKLGCLAASVSKVRDRLMYPAQ